MTATRRRPITWSALTAHLWLSVALCVAFGVGAAWGAYRSREWAILVAAILGAFALSEALSALTLAWLRRRLVGGASSGLAAGWTLAAALTLWPFAAIVAPRFAR